ncbi:MAG: hypothetical protein AB7D39_19720 [Pseudodesulfovibrio sp.]|jgi:hypothetical protein|uniref:Uncharacterized protein n=1 Tax=Pseudodesulfovibrio indicus TaxID=1716143 RepID=A0AA94TLX1_9BACT|nr:hypothetical protein [Pseudodesulfovibrio indicus]TDT91971.1 hypothetical protein EDC59_101374 [Pseudodesulfovibrio indicus]
MFKKLFYVCLWLCFLSTTAYTDAVPARLAQAAVPAPVISALGR